MPLKPLRRKCRACGTTTTVDVVDTECPACAEPYGSLTFGLDADPDEAWAGKPRTALPPYLPPLPDPNADSPVPSKVARPEPTMDSTTTAGGIEP